MKKLVLAVFAVASVWLSAGAQLFSSAMPDRLFTLGVRAGVNTSNQTLAKDFLTGWNQNSWGTGFELGAVGNLNMRDFLTIQPGLFFETRSGSYVYESGVLNEASGMVGDVAGSMKMGFQTGRYRDYRLTVPLMAVFWANVGPALQWNLHGGPYWSWTLHRHGDEWLELPDRDLIPYGWIKARRNKYDWGLKLGTGIRVLRHLTLDVSYKWGLHRVWNHQQLGGRSKLWSVTAGVDF